MKTIAQFWQEDNGKFSMNRLLASVIVVVGLCYGLMEITYSLGLVTIGCGLIGYKNYDTRKKNESKEGK